MSAKSRAFSPIEPSDPLAWISQETRKLAEALDALHPLIDDEPDGEHQAHSIVCELTAAGK
jgi:hypothetical protein